ncbi:hypothetical protein BDZ45DRAFT_699209 [Acephala macrosclerotiorum]|nr:hypothetical protein BDZ45DRAFT_699209 [Acephala macrosclerotiorum]
MSFVPYTSSRLRQAYTPSQPIPVQAIHYGSYRRLRALHLANTADTSIDDSSIDFPPPTNSPTSFLTIDEIAVSEVLTTLEDSSIEMPSTADPTAAKALPALPASRLPTPKVGRISGPPRIVDVPGSSESSRIQDGARGPQLNKALPPQPSRRTSSIPTPIKSGVEKSIQKSQAIEVIDEHDDKPFHDQIKKAIGDDDNDKLSSSDGDSIMGMTDEQRRATMYGISTPNLRLAKDADEVIMGGGPGSIKRNETKKGKIYGKGLGYGSSKTFDKAEIMGSDKSVSIGMGIGIGSTSSKTVDKDSSKGFDKSVGIGMGKGNTSGKTVDKCASKGFGKFVGKNSPKDGIENGRRATTANLRRARKSNVDVAGQFRTNNSTDHNLSSRMATDTKSADTRRATTQPKMNTERPGLKSRVSAMLHSRRASGVRPTLAATAGPAPTLNADERFNASLRVLGSEIGKFRAKSATATDSAQARRFTEVIAAHMEGLMLVNQARVVRLQAMAMMDSMAMDEVRSVAEAIQSVHDMTAQLES